MTTPIQREETRRERYNKKLKDAVIMPVSICVINFRKEANIAYVIRAAACFGAEEVMVIGSTPNRDTMNDLSGSTYDYINLRKFSNTMNFIEHCRENKIRMVAAEPPGEYINSISINDFNFDFSRKTVLIVGGETSGLTMDVLVRSECVYIDMPGIGHCLNNSQCANILLFEAAKRYNLLL